MHCALKLFDFDKLNIKPYFIRERGDFMLIGEVTLSTVLTDVGSVFTSMIGYVGSVCQAIVDNPLLLIGFCIPFVFAIITFVKKMF